MSRARETRPVAADTGPAPLARNIRVDEVKDGAERVFEASAAERAAMAGLLELAALDSLKLVCRFTPRGQGRLLMRGTLSAAVTQTCVVSLEPIASAIELPVELEFWPARRIDEFAESADEAASQGVVDWPEPIVEGKIDLGPVLYETFATALDPYPRREGASFDWSEAGAETAETERPESPFAALAPLKRR